MNTKSLQEMKDEYKKSLLEMKDESLEWDKYQIQSYKYWTQHWKLGAIVCQRRQTSINKTKLVSPNHHHYGYLTKTYTYKSKRDLLKIHQEYLIVKKLGILVYLDIAYGKNNNEIYITMDLLEYTLKKAVTKKIDNHIHDFGCFYSDINLRYFILEMAGCLYQLHSNEYIHCDIKPSNVCWRNHKGDEYLIYGNGWKLIDLGNVKYVNRKVYKNGYILLNHYSGTVGWTAPEMSPYGNKTKPNKISTKTDIWSFGLLILYIINNGKNIFDVTNKDIIEYNLTDKNKKKLFFYDKLRTLNVRNYLMELWLEGKMCYDLYNLLSLMLKYEQSNRISVLDIVKHEYFKDYVHIGKGNQNMYFVRRNSTRHVSRDKKVASWIPLIYNIC